MRIPASTHRTAQHPSRVHFECTSASFSTIINRSSPPQSVSVRCELCVDSISNWNNFRNINTSSPFPIPKLCLPYRPLSRKLPRGLIFYITITVINFPPFCQMLFYCHYENGFCLLLRFLTFGSVDFLFYWTSSSKLTGVEASSGKLIDIAKYLKLLPKLNKGKKHTWEQN